MEREKKDTENCLVVRDSQRSNYSELCCHEELSWLLKLQRAAPQLKCPACSLLSAQTSWLNHGEQILTSLVKKNHLWKGFLMSDEA